MRPFVIGNQLQAIIKVGIINSHPSSWFFLQAQIGVSRAEESPTGAVVTWRMYKCIHILLEGSFVSPSTIFQFNIWLVLGHQPLPSV